MSKRAWLQARPLIVIGAIAMTAMVLLSLSSWVSAQSVAVVGSPKQVNNDNGNRQECSVAVTRFPDHDEVVVAARRYPGGNIGYGVSLNGGGSFTNGVLSWPQAGDTVVAVDPATHRLWITALSATFQTISIRGAWKEPLAGQYHQNDNYTLIGPVPVPGVVLDRPTLYVLSHGQYGGRHLLTYIDNRDNLEPDPPTCSLAAWSAFSDTPYAKNTWTQRHRMEPDLNVNVYDNVDNGCRWQGWGGRPWS